MQELGLNSHRDHKKSQAGSWDAPPRSRLCTLPMVPPRGLNTCLIKVLGPSVNFQEIQGNQNKLSKPQYGVMKKQTMTNCISQTPWVLQQINCKKKNRVMEDHLDGRRREKDSKCLKLARRSHCHYRCRLA